MTFSDVLAKKMASGLPTISMTLSGGGGGGVGGVIMKRHNDVK